MKKARKFIVAALIFCAFFAACVFSLAACGSDDAELISIEVTQKPNKTVYVSGESFDGTGMEVSARYSDGGSRVLGADEYSVDAPKLNVPSGKFKENKTVKISYAENGAEKTANLGVTVTNYVISAEIISNPDKTQYYPGEQFDPTGLKISGTLENGAKIQAEITDNNASFSAEIAADAVAVAVTYGGYTFDVPITVKSGVYIEAESGLLNGKSVSGANYREIALSEISENVVKLYEAHLKVAYEKKLTDIKRAELIAAEESNIDGALNAYLQSDEYKTALDEYPSTSEFADAVAAYKNGENSDIAEWNYKADVAHYRAHGDAYLGDIGKGDEVSFVFRADKACTGSIAFRLSSTYLLKDDGNWSPVEMGDVRFNELCEFYVNGVKAEIDNSVKLEGGKTEDGSPNVALWTNWKEVRFDNIDLVAGRNVILLKMRDHSLVSPAHADNKATPNIDSLIISADDAEIVAYDNTESLDYTVTDVSIDSTAGVVVKVSGNISVSAGYVADIFNVKLGSTVADITLEGDKFTAVVNVEDFETSADGYAVTVCGKTVPSGDMEIDTQPISAYREYRLDAENFVKLIISDGTYSVKLDKAEITDPAVSLEIKDGKPYIVIGGGTYAATTQGFDLTNPADKAEIYRQLAAEIKKQYVFNAENNPSNGGAGNWGERALDGEHTVVIKDDNKFEVVCELSALKTGRRYGIHFNNKAATGGDGKYDLNNVNFPSFTKLELTSITIGTTKYEAFYNDETGGYTFSWNCLAIAVSDARKLEHKEVSLEKTDDKIYVVISGTYEVYTKAEAETALAAIKADYSYNKALGNTVENTDISLEGKITAAVSEGEGGGTYTLKLDITEATAGTIFFHLDFNDGTTNFRCPLTQTGLKKADAGTRSFTLLTTANTGSSGGWADGLVAVKISDTAVKSYGVAALVGFEEADGKAYAVFSGDCNGYTADELRDMITLIDFENSTDSNHKIQGTVYTVTVDNGKYYIKCDISALTVIEDKNGRSGGYFVHIKPFGSGDNGDVNRSGDVDALEVGGYSYSAEDCTISWEGGSWTGHIIKIRAI